MTATAKSVSVVIPSYNPGDKLLKCLNSIFTHKTDIVFEVIVVDSSPGNPAEMIHAHYPEVKVIHRQQRTYAGKARAIGVKEAKNDLICFTDSDCLVQDHWLDQLINGYSQGYTVVQGSVGNGTPHSIWGTVEYLTEFRRLNPGFRPHEIETMATCNLLVHRSVFQDMGDFPDIVKCEDTIFCEKIMKHDYKIYFNPDACILHLNRTGFAHYINNQINLGEGENEVRRRTNRYGSFLIKYPFLLPLVPVYRTIRMWYEFGISDKKYLLQSFLLYPFILTGFFAHVWGFIRGPYKH